MARYFGLSYEKAVKQTNSKESKGSPEKLFK